MAGPLWDALQEDDMPYLEYLGGKLCTTPEIASKWAGRARLQEETTKILKLRGINP
jgi:hypothetical protein